uniref:Uncharacterized protein n=1 Tax=Knipowitschia caucasica TaxID=637954 RepID=A0AAV2LMV1_KNICA
MALTRLPLLREVTAPWARGSCAGGKLLAAVWCPVGTHVGLCCVSAALGKAFCSLCGTELHLPRQFGDCQSERLHQILSTVSTGATPPASAVLDRPHRPESLQLWTPHL